ncbi:MAG: single-stranded DNA-binding protein [Saprospiraceae bacterium]
MISNNITLIGNLGSDIAVNEFANDKRVGRVNLAYSSSFTNKLGEREERTDWFNLTIWNKTCERMVTQVGKGSRVLVEGKLVTGSYQNKEGQKVNTVEVVVNSFQKIERSEKASAAPAQSMDEVPAF